ncbi:MAG: hypothetical protein IJO70_10350 [Lachnospiraceae bacterium]|nr:hypothetical protein [Lachnospiraceae bacterium]
MKRIYYSSKKLMVFLYVLGIFPLLSENVVSTLFGELISKFLSVVSCFIILIDIIRNKKIKLNPFLFFLFLAVVEHIIITFVFAPEDLIISHYNNLITPYGLIAYFVLFCLISANLNNKKHFLEILKAITIIMTISVFLNLFITGDFKIADNIAVFQEAITTGYTNSRKWLFGHRNMIFIHHLMWILVTYLYYEVSNKQKRKILFFEIIFTLLVGVVSWNTTMIVTTILMTSLWILKDTKFIKKIKPHYYILFFAFLEIGIVFGRIQRHFEFLIVNILHRNLSFTGRTRIWDYYIQQFVSGSMFNKLFGNFGVTNINSNAHNMFLGLLAFSGIFGVVIYAILIILAIVKINRNNSHEIATFLSIIIFCFLINSLTMEFYIQPLIPLFFGYNISDMILLKRGKL